MNNFTSSFWRLLTCSLKLIFIANKLDLIQTSFVKQKIYGWVSKEALKQLRSWIIFYSAFNSLTLKLLCWNVWLVLYRDCIKCVRGCLHTAIECNVCVFESVCFINRYYLYSRLLSQSSDSSAAYAHSHQCKFGHGRSLPTDCVSKINTQSLKNSWGLDSKCCLRRWCVQPEWTLIWG